jgi:type II secretory pathway pseudopilin PulG
MTKTFKTGESGFTVIELITVTIILIVAGLLVFNQITSLNRADADSQRKTAVNAMYYALEEVYYKQNGSYPATLTPETLPSVDPSLFTDPDGFTLGKEALSEDELRKLINDGDANDDVKKRFAAVSAGKGPNYHYDPTNCDTDGKCKSYTIRADLITEAEYVKKSRNS